MRDEGERESEQGGTNNASSLCSHRMAHQGLCSVKEGAGPATPGQPRLCGPRTLSAVIGCPLHGVIDPRRHQRSEGPRGSPSLSYRSARTALTSMHAQPGLVQAMPKERKPKQCAITPSPTRPGAQRPLSSAGPGNLGRAPAPQCRYTALWTPASGLESRESTGRQGPCAIPGRLPHRRGWVYHPSSISCTVYGPLRFARPTRPPPRSPRGWRYEPAIERLRTQALRSPFWAGREASLGRNARRLRLRLADASTGHRRGRPERILGDR